jgi:spore coat protein CotH
MHLDVNQMLLFGGVNALVANSDAPLVKENNYYFYDDPAGAPRLYIPWDLDTTMMGTPPIFGAPGTTVYTSVLFTHWEDDYDGLLTQLLAGPLTAQAMLAELDRVQAIAGAALDADPTFDGGAIADEIANMKTWWSARHAQVSAELSTHAP